MAKNEEEKGQFRDLVRIFYHLRRIRASTEIDHLLKGEAPEESEELSLVKPLLDKIVIALDGFGDVSPESGIPDGPLRQIVMQSRVASRLQASNAAANAATMLACFDDWASPGSADPSASPAKGIPNSVVARIASELASPSDQILNDDEA